MTGERDTPSPRVKICGLMRNEDALRAEAAGADYLGVVLSPGFRRSLESDAAAAVMAGTALPRVAVLVDEAPERAVELASRVEASVLQLHGSEDRSVVRSLHDAGAWTVWKVVRARSLTDIRQVTEAVGDVVDGILVEGWRRGVTGGGGVRLALDPDEVWGALPPDVDFILAGGLEPGSVGDAVARFRPDVVDVSSGVERALGEKSGERIDAFVRGARRPASPERMTEELRGDT